MECYNHLTEWQPLEYCSTLNIDSANPPDLNKIWNDPFHQVVLYIVHYHMYCMGRNSLVFLCDNLSFFDAGKLSALHDSQ